MANYRHLFLLLCGTAILAVAGCDMPPGSAPFHHDDAATGSMLSSPDQGANVTNNTSSLNSHHMTSGPGGN